IPYRLGPNLSVSRQQQKEGSMKNETAYIHHGIVPLAALLVLTQASCSKKEDTWTDPPAKMKVPKSVEDSLSRVHSSYENKQLDKPLLPSAVSTKGAGGVVAQPARPPRR